MFIDTLLFTTNLPLIYVFNIQEKRNFIVVFLPVLMMQYNICIKTFLDRDNITLPCIQVHIHSYHGFTVS